MVELTKVEHKRRLMAAYNRLKVYARRGMLSQERLNKGLGIALRTRHPYVPSRPIVTTLDNGGACSCPDFYNRGLPGLKGSVGPCKHLLALMLERAAKEEI